MNFGEHYVTHSMDSINNIFNIICEFKCHLTKENPIFPIIGGKKSLHGALCRFSLSVNDLVKKWSKDYNIMCSQHSLLIEKIHMAREEDPERNTEMEAIPLYFYG